MRNMSAAINTPAPMHKSPQEYIAEFYELVGETGRGAYLWGKLDKKNRISICELAGFKLHRIDLHLTEYSEFERNQLLRTIKQLGIALKQFDNVSFSDFK